MKHGGRVHETGCILKKLLCGMVNQPFSCKFVEKIRKRYAKCSAAGFIRSAKANLDCERLCDVRQEKLR